MNHRLTSRDYFYRIAFLLGVAALAVVFGSAAWILGRGIINIAATKKPPEIQVVTLEQRQDRLNGVSPVVTHKANLVIAVRKSAAEPAKAFAKLTAIEGRVAELPVGIINAIPDVTESLLGAPQKLAPWLDDRAIVETSISAAAQTTQVPQGSLDATTAGTSVSGLGISRTGAAVAGEGGGIRSGLRGGIRSGLSGKVGQGRIW
jgi:hypothetical protein